MARPKNTPTVHFDKAEFTGWDIINTACAYGATLQECASLVDVNPKTVVAKILLDFGVTFGEYRQRFHDKQLVKLRQEMFKMAISGKHPSITIFYAKNKLGMSDKTEVQNISTEMTLEQFIKYQDNKDKPDGNANT